MHLVLINDFLEDGDSVETVLSVLMDQLTGARDHHLNLTQTLICVGPLPVQRPVCACVCNNNVDCDVCTMHTCKCESVCACMYMHINPVIHYTRHILDSH